MVQVGHVDAGKSTLMGRILHLLGRVTQKEMHKNEKESKQQVLTGKILTISLSYFYHKTAINVFSTYCVYGHLLVDALLQR